MYVKTTKESIQKEMYLEGRRIVLHRFIALLNSFATDEIGIEEFTEGYVMLNKVLTKCLAEGISIP